MVLDCNECDFCGTCCKTIKECREHGGGKKIAPQVSEELSMLGNGYFGVVRWCNEDIVNLLREMGVEPTESNVSAVRCACENHHFTDTMIEAGWAALELYARDALKL